MPPDDLVHELNSVVIVVDSDSLEAFKRTLSSAFRAFALLDLLRKPSCHKADSGQRRERVESASSSAIFSHGAAGGHLQSLEQNPQFST
jgi:hypothetical protein